MADEKQKYFYLIIDRDDPNDCKAFGPFKTIPDLKNSVEEIRKEESDNDAEFVITEVIERSVPKFEWTTDTWEEDDADDD